MEKVKYRYNRWRLALGRLVNLRYINRWIIFCADLFISLCVSLIGVLGLLSIMHVYISGISVLKVGIASFVASILSFLTFKVYHGVIRHSTLRGLWRIGGVAITKSILMFILLHLLKADFNSSIYWVGGITDCMLTIVLLITLRVFVINVYNSVLSQLGKKRKRVLVFGMDEDSVMIATSPNRQVFMQNYSIIGFLTFGSAKKNLRIAELPVYQIEDIDDLLCLIPRNNLDGILFPNIKTVRRERDRLIHYCEQASLKPLVVPDMEEVHEGGMKRSVREIRIEDLLGREEISINLGEIDVKNVKFTPAQLAELVRMADTEKISKNDAKTVFRTMAEQGGDPEKLAEKAGFIIIVDTEKVGAEIDKILAANAAQVQQYASGEKKVFGFIMGQCTKALKGFATPKLIKGVLEEKLAAVSVADDTADNKAEEEESYDISALTPYTNPDKYVPEADGAMLMVSPEKLLGEFTLSDALNNIGKVVDFKACVHRIRKMAGVTFIVVRTAFCTIQTVYNEKDCADSIQGLREGFFVWVKGTVTENPKDFNGVEIQLSDIRLISTPKSEMPLKISQGRLNCAIDTKLDNRVAALRNPYERAIFKLQEGLVHGMHIFMKKNNFTEIHTPKIVAQGAEGGANIFRLDYFQKNAFLNQSPQFYKQACVGVFNRVYEIAPVYRAEKHATSRHINEYIGLDLEMGYIDSMYDVMAMETAMLKFIMEYITENYAYELKILEADVPQITEIPSIKFIDAIKMLRGDNAAGKKFDLDPEDEVNLGKYAKEKYNSDFIFVTHFPSSKPPFYAMNSREDPKEAYKFDLLFRGLEITSGGQRIHDYDEQVAKMKAQGLDPADFKSYLDAHKYGLPPHGGLGIGLERLLMKLLNKSNIRETSMFPRDINRLIP